MKRTIIYVFGPKRLAAKYFGNEEMVLQEGGWLKIGQTSSEDDSKDKSDCAMDRIKVEPHTGIPEVSQLFDVFEYPFKNGNNDDVIRTILSEDIYKLESSKLHNRGLDKYEIKAGREFIYGVCRSQLLNAIAKYERDLVLENYGKEVFSDLMRCIMNNNAVDEVPFEPDVNNDITESNDSNSEWCNQLWDSVISGLNGRINEHINNPKGRPYIFFKSTKVPDLTYSIGYSTRYGMTSVGVEIFTGEEGKKQMEDYIFTNKIDSTIHNLKIKQGAKRKDKWAWSVSDTIEKSYDEIVDWYVSTILLFYKEFERL